MGYYRRGGYQFGSTRLIVKLEHLLFAGVVVVVISVICLLISSVIQLGDADLVNAAFQSLMSIISCHSLVCILGDIDCRDYIFVAGWWKRRIEQLRQSRI